MGILTARKKNACANIWWSCQEKRTWGDSSRKEVLIGNKLQRTRYIKMCKMPNRCLCFWFFFFFFLPPFSKSSVPQQLCVLAQRFSKYKFLYVGSISAFQSLLYLQLGSSRKGEQRHSTCRYEYCHFYLIRVYSLTENHVMQQTYKKADVLVKKLTVTKESQRKTPYYACYCLHS